MDFWGFFLSPGELWSSGFGSVCVQGNYVIQGLGLAEYCSSGCRGQSHDGIQGEFRGMMMAFRVAFRDFCPANYTNPKTGALQGIVFSKSTDVGFHVCLHEGRIGG